MNIKTFKLGMLAVGKKDTDYNGLLGEITHVTKTNSGYQYQIKFVKTQKMNTTHPHLNFKRIDNVILDEEDLIFFPETWLNDGIDSEGNNYTFTDVICTYPNYQEFVQDCYLPF